MNENNLSPLEIYINNIFKFVIVIIPSIALCAGLTFTVLHASGFYPTVNVWAITIFDITCVIYTIIGIIFNRTCNDKDGKLKPNSLKYGKVFLAILMFIQWNFISYMIPSRDFWAYSFYFVLLASAFLDSKFLLIIIIEIVGSMGLSWILRSEDLLPVNDSLYIPEMALRGVVIILFFMALFVIVFTIEKRLTKELEKISDFDTLTLLYNRRKLDMYLDNAIKQNKGDFSVIMADIDDFKRVNDTYGHSYGDEVLKDIANIMRTSVNDKGLVFRYGGEEILVLLYLNENETYNIAEEIRRRVQNHTTLYDDCAMNVTLTLGVAEYKKLETKEKLIERADANLYYGKNHGKNCVIK